MFRTVVRDVRLVRLVVVKVFQQLKLSLPFNSPESEELEIDFEPDEGEKEPGQYWNGAQQGPHVKPERHEQVQQEDQTTQQEEQDENQVKDEPRHDEFDVEINPTDDQEDVGQEPDEVCRESRGEDQVGVLEREEVRDSFDQAGVDHDEHQDGARAEQEVHGAEEGAQHLENVAWGRSDLLLDLHGGHTGEDYTGLPHVTQLPWC